MSLATHCTFQSPRPLRGRTSRRVLSEAVFLLVIAVLGSVTPQVPQLAVNAENLPKREPALNSKVKDQVATCTNVSSEQNPEPATLSAAISEEANSLTLTCNGTSDNDAVPSTMTEGMVCLPEKGSEGTLTACEPAKGKEKTNLTTIKVSELLGSQNTLAWSKTVNGSGTSYRLTLEKEDFPYVDRTFLVGCMKKTVAGSECRLNVAVKARASAVRGNVATCAYGEASNAAALEFRMTPEKNTFTLVCGTEGSSRPEGSKFKTEFCAGTDVAYCTSTSTYESILPGFKSEWWSTATQGNAQVLTIPPENFPEKEQTFLVGCALSSETSTKSESSGCKVKVTVTAKPGRSSAPQTSYAIVGFYVAVLSVLFALLL